jgi:hypothetical protein
VQAQDQNGPHIGQVVSMLQSNASEQTSQGSGTRSQTSMDMLQLQSGALCADAVRHDRT